MVIDWLFVETIFKHVFIPAFISPLSERLNIFLKRKSLFGKKSAEQSLLFSTLKDI